MTATLIVGLGGMGQKVVRKISDIIDKEGLTDVELVVMDTDVNDLRQTKEEYPHIFTVQTSPRGTVGGALDQNQFARERWFPINDGLTGKPFTEGAGQVRAVSRLALDHAIEKGYMAELERAIEKLRSLSGETMRQEMRIMIIGSNNGGTGSGLVLPVAMYIRNFLITRYQDNSAIIRAFLLEPDTIFDRIVDEEERNSLRCNAYATIREIDAFFRKEYAGDSDEFKHVVFNATQPGSGERADYPNILPYHFIFLMDAINSEGEHLPNHEAYLQHAAETVYAQTLSAISARSNSSEDNVIRNLAANNGRSRYCGAGASFLEYPKRDIQRYIGLNWAASNISKEWLEIDELYKRTKQDDDELTIADHYSTTFKSLMDSQAFYRRIGHKKVFVEYEAEGGRVQRMWPADEFPDAVMDRAETVQRTEVSRACSEMQRALASFEKIRIPSTAEAILNLAEGSDNPATDISNRFDQYYEVARRYNASVDSEVEAAASRIAANNYLVRDFNESPLATNTAAWQVESLLRVEEGGGIGAKHPGAVRYMLYSASLALADAIEDCESEIAGAKQAIKSFIDQQERLEDSSNDEAADDGKKGKKKRGKLSMPWKTAAALDETTIGLMTSQATRLQGFKKRIDKRIDMTVKRAFLTEAKKYVDALSKSYEEFYAYLGGQIDGMQREIASIEHNPLYKNNADGQTHRYVCASEKCLHRISEESPLLGDSSELPAELCARIYNRLLAYSQIDGNARTTDVKTQAFKDVFKETIIDYWVTKVMDPGQAASSVVDKNIAQAIADEAVYLHEEPFASIKEQEAFISSYVRMVFDQTFHLAAPFIEPPVGETPRTFRTCAYSASLFDESGPYTEALDAKLSEYNGMTAKGFNKYSIMFYRSMYGFCATNLPKYAPAHDGLQPMPEGEYHHAYYMLVNRLSPNLKENKLITPHIDKNWHLVEFLPELNEEFEAGIKQNIVRAYIFGLIYQQFKARMVSTGDDVYYLASTARQPETHLWVTNGTPCDRFYEVYDAVKFNPRAVAMLIERSENEKQRERDSSTSTSVENCRLVRNVRSEAFRRIWDEDNVRAITAKIIADIMQLKNRDYEAVSSRERQMLDTSLVTDFFGLGDAEMDSFGWDFGFDEKNADQDDHSLLARRSLLEIPVYYRISLPQSETRSGEFDTMIESIFAVVRAHLSEFCDAEDLDNQSGRFFEEQYLLFEKNLVDIERNYPGISSNSVVNAIREKTLSYMEAVDSRFERVKKVQVGIEKAWRSIR